MAPVALVKPSKINQITGHWLNGLKQITSKESQQHNVMDDPNKAETTIATKEKTVRDAGK